MGSQARPMEGIPVWDLVVMDALEFWVLGDDGRYPVSWRPEIMKLRQIGVNACIAALHEVVAHADVVHTHHPYSVC